MRSEDLKAKLKGSALAGRAGSACARMTRSPLFAPALLVTVLIWELGVLFLKASRKLFWFDELFTFHISNLHPVSLLWKALQAGVDGMPPGYYLLAQLAGKLPGDPLVTLRLPSILGYLLSLLGVYWFARKTLPAFAGLAAMLLITLSPFREYALEARPYSLLVGLLAISAVLWQRIDEKRFMTPLFTLFLTLAVSSHYLAVVAVSSFGIAELTWTLLSRRIRWGVWASCLLATSPFFLALPLLLRFRGLYGKNFWSQPSWSMIVSTYGSSYLGLDSNLALVLIAFFGIVVGGWLLRMCRTPREELLDKRYFGLTAIILVGGFLYYPALLVVLTKLLGSGYTTRYGSPAVLGMALGSVYLLRAFWRRSSSIHLLVALLIAFAFQGGQDFRLLSKAGSPTLDEKRWTTLAEISRHEPSVPVVIGSPLSYLEAAEYAPPELRARLVEVNDPDAAARLIVGDTAERGIRVLAQFVPLRLEDPAVFQAEHQRFLLCSGGNGEWFTDYLLAQKYHLTLLSNLTASSKIYLAER